MGEGEPGTRVAKPSRAIDSRSRLHGAPRRWTRVASRCDTIRHDRTHHRSSASAAKMPSIMAIRSMTMVFSTRRFGEATVRVSAGVSASRRRGRPRAASLRESASKLAISRRARAISRSAPDSPPSSSNASRDGSSSSASASPTSPSSPSTSSRANENDRTTLIDVSSSSRAVAVVRPLDAGLARSSRFASTVTPGRSATASYARSAANDLARARSRAELRPVQTVSRRTVASIARASANASHAFSNARSNRAASPRVPLAPSSRVAAPRASRRRRVDARPRALRRRVVARRRRRRRRRRRVSRARVLARRRRVAVDRSRRSRGERRRARAHAHASRSSSPRARARLARRRAASPRREPSRSIVTTEAKRRVARAHRDALDRDRDGERASWCARATRRRDARAPTRRARDASAG